MRPNAVSVSRAGPPDNQPRQLGARNGPVTGGWLLRRRRSPHRPVIGTWLDPATDVAATRSAHPSRPPDLDPHRCLPGYRDLDIGRGAGPPRPQPALSPRAAQPLLPGPGRRAHPRRHQEARPVHLVASRLVRSNPAAPTRQEGPAHRAFLPRPGSCVAVLCLVVLPEFSSRCSELRWEPAGRGRGRPTAGRPPVGPVAPRGPSAPAE